MPPSKSHVAAILQRRSRCERTADTTLRISPQHPLPHSVSGWCLRLSDNRSPRFQRVKAPVKDELEDLVQLISQRVGRCLERQGLPELEGSLYPKDALPAKSDRVIGALLDRGELSRAEVRDILGISERSSQRITRALFDKGIIKSIQPWAPFGSSSTLS